MQHHPHAPRRGDIFTLHVERLIPGGHGSAALALAVGPQHTPRRFAMIIPRALPGDVVEVEVTRRRRAEVRTRVLRLITRSDLRTPPRCPHATQTPVDVTRGCGGCPVQCLSYASQCALKEQWVRDLIQGVGLDLSRVQPLRGLDEPWFYRNKMEFSFGPDANDQFALGLHPAGFKFEVLRLDTCLLESPFVAEVLPPLRAWFEAQRLPPFKHREATGWLRTLTIREGKRTGERMVILTTTAEDPVVEGQTLSAQATAEAFSVAAREIASQCGGDFSSMVWIQHRAVRGERTRWIEHVLHGSPTLREQLHLPGGRRLTFEIHPRAFFQPNTRQAEQLYAEVLHQAQLLEPKAAPRTVLDLYCGTGTIGLCMAPYADHVVGVELQKDAVDNARRNAVSNGIENVTFFAGDVGKVIATEDFKARAEHLSLAVVDPPRAGLQSAAREHLLAIAPPRLVYVSCNPETLARDLKFFVGEGYQLEKIQPVDMFPHTWHVENVALLTRQG